jgi:hypothetical protein
MNIWFKLRLLEYKKQIYVISILIIFFTGFWSNNLVEYIKYKDRNIVKIDIDKRDYIYYANIWFIPYERYVKGTLRDLTKEWYINLSMWDDWMIYKFAWNWPLKEGEMRFEPIMRIMWAKGYRIGNQNWIWGDI